MVDLSNIKPIIDTKTLIKQEYANMAADPVYFMRKYCYIQHPKKGRLLFDLYDFQELSLRDFRDYDRNIILKSRQLGISTVCAGYILWLMLFNQDKNCLVIATKQEVAKNLVTKVRVMYDNLPEWLRKLVPHKSHNKLSLELENGSVVKATTSSSDAGRSEAVSLLVIDECVTGDTMVTVRNKTTGEILEVPISEIYHRHGTYNSTNYMFKVVTELEVMTPTGWSDFSGIQKNTHDAYLEVICTCNTILKCSLGHHIKLDGGEFLEAQFIQPGDILFGGFTVDKTILHKTEVELYDICDVDSESTYYTNGIASHNCAFVEETVIRDIWGGVQQTLATGGKCIILSTPNGMGNFFHQMWENARLGENGFNTIRLPWYVHPDRDQSWRDKQTVELGRELAAQECDCDFRTSGTNVIDVEILKVIEDSCIQPIEKRLQDNSYWIFKYAEPNKKYMVIGDVARGDGADNSAAQVMDLETMELVAEFRGKIDTSDYGRLLVSIASEYNGALLVIENSNIGWATIQTVLDIGYENLFYGSSDMLYVETHATQTTNKIKEKLVPGFSTTNKNRPMMITKFKESIESGDVKINSARTASEIRSFVWINGKAQAQTNYTDDLVMAMAIGIWVRDTALRMHTAKVKIQENTLTLWNKSISTMNERKNMVNNDVHKTWKVQVGKNTEDLRWLL